MSTTIQLGLAGVGLIQPFPNPPAPGPRIMIDCSASAISSIPSNADIVCPGPHWSPANVAAALAIATSAVLVNICDLNQVGVTSSGVNYYDCDAFDDELNLGYSTLPAAQAANIGWLANHQSAHPGELGLSYMFQGNLSSFLASAVSAGCAGSYMWPADHTNVLHNFNYAAGYPSGFVQVVTQWEGTSHTGTIDVSTVQDPNWFISYQLHALVAAKKARAQRASAKAAEITAAERGGYRVDCSNGGWTLFEDYRRAKRYADRTNGLKKVPMPNHEKRGDSSAAWRELGDDGFFTGECEHTVTRLVAA